MAAPIGTDFKWYDGANGVPTNDDDPILGAIDTGAPITPGESGQLIAPGEADVVGGSNRVHYGGGYIKNEEGAGGSLLNGSLWLANGGLVIPSASTLVITDPTGENEGLELVVGGVTGGGPHTEEVTITSGSAETSVVFATSSEWWIATKSNAAIAGLDGVDDLVITCGATQVGKMRAPLSGHYASGCLVVTSMYKLSVCNAYDETMTAADRETSPTASSGMSTFNSGAYLDGSDQRHALSTFADDTYKGFALRRTIPPGMYMPAQGLPHVLMLTGLASA